MQRASIVGTVADRSGAVVVRVNHETTNTVIALRTDDFGNYSGPSLVPGNCAIIAEHAGFSRRAYRGLRVQVGHVARFDIAIEVGAVDQTVEVTGTIPLLHTSSSIKKTTTGPRRRLWFSRS